MDSNYRLVFVTASSVDEADRISLALVKEKLAACVNIAPKITSRYWWQGKIETANESLLIIKSKKSLLPKLIARVKALHSYSVPEVIAFPILEGNPEYLQWIKESI